VTKRSSCVAWLKGKVASARPLDRGGNWDEEAWPGSKLPTRWMIDPVHARQPRLISRYDGHAALANSLALKLAGVTKDTPEPQAVSSSATRRPASRRGFSGCRPGVGGAGHSAP